MRFLTPLATGLVAVVSPLLLLVPACVGDNIEPPPISPDADPSGPDASNDAPATDGPADDAGDAGPPPAVGTHKFFKSWPGLVNASPIGVLDESVIIAGQGIAAFNVDDKPVTTPVGSTDAVVVRIDASGKPLWASTFGGSGQEIPQGSSASAAGIFTAGLSMSATMSVGPDTLTPGVNRWGYVAKLDPTTGAPIWARAVASDVTNNLFSCAKGVAATTGGVAVACAFVGTTITVGGQPALVGVEGGGMDTVVALFDAAGAVKWSNVFKGTLDDKSAAVAADPSGDVLVALNVTSPILRDIRTPVEITKPGAATASVPYVARLSAVDGKVVWSKFLGGGGARATSLAASKDGKTVAVGGSLDAQVDFGIGPLAPKGMGDGFVVLVEQATRAVKTQKQIGGTGGGELVQDVAFDDFGQIAVVGYNGSTDTSIDGKPIPSPPQDVTSGYASFALKLSATGELLWAKGFATQALADAVGIESVAFTSKHEVRAGGGMQGTAPLDGTNPFSAEPGTYQGIVWGWAP
ncbi:MAG: hypothetical protein KF819_27705 [Labilithrix sp.]|nr:hypothetical protein [Labilithrix sp.]